MNLARKLEVNEDILQAESLRERLAPAMERMKTRKRGRVSRATLDKMRIIVAADRILDREE